MSPVPVTSRGVRSAPAVAVISKENEFWHQKQPPPGFHEQITRVAVPIPAREVVAVAPDPPALVLWVICKNADGNRTARLFMGKSGDPLRLVEASTPFQGRRVDDIAARPGDYDGPRQLAAIQGPDAGLWSSHQDKVLCKLPAGTCRVRFNADGSLLAYGTRKGKLGVLKVPDAATLARGRTKELEPAMHERCIRDCKADDWVLAFNATGDRLYFIKVDRSERLTGWITVPNAIAYVLQPTITDSIDDWAFAIGLPPIPARTAQPANHSERVCFGGISYECHIGSPSPDEPKLKRIRISRDSLWVEGLQLAGDKALIVRTKKALFAVDPTGCTEERGLVTGKMPSGAHVEQYHHVGCWTNPDGTHTLFTIVTLNQAAISEDACAGKGGAHPDSKPED